jgi:hypothetical protein
MSLGAPGDGWPLVFAERDHRRPQRAPRRTEADGAHSVRAWPRTASLCLEGSARTTRQRPLSDRACCEAATSSCQAERAFSQQRRSSNNAHFVVKRDDTRTAPKRLQYANPAFLNLTTMVEGMGLEPQSFGKPDRARRSCPSDPHGNEGAKGNLAVHAGSEHMRGPPRRRIHVRAVVIPVAIPGVIPVAIPRRICRQRTASFGPYVVRRPAASRLSKRRALRSDFAQLRSCACDNLV